MQICKIREKLNNYNNMVIFMLNKTLFKDVYALIIQSI